jgi:basic membrane protein A
MGKKLLSRIIIVLILIGLNLIGCQNNSEIKVGMITDSGTIDDQFINQGIWESMEQYKKDNKADIHFTQTGGNTKEDFNKSIEELIEAGYEIIIMPGFQSGEAFYEAQEKHKDTKFIVINGTPSPVLGNTVAIDFASEEAGFLAGVIAALESEKGEIGFIGGKEINQIQKLGWGFVSGVAYANKTYATDVKVTQYTYKNFEDAQTGKELASQMYEAGIDIIFTAAGSIGVGVLEEAKTRALTNESVYVMGALSDLYESGIYAENESVVLPTATLKIDKATYDYIRFVDGGNFPGGQTITFNLKNNGIALSEHSPNLDPETIRKSDETRAKIEDGSIQIPSDLESLKKFLEEYQYKTPGDVHY